MLPVDLRGGLHLQVVVNDAALAWVDFKTLHSLAFSENVEKMSQQQVVVDKLCCLRDHGGKYCSLSIQHAHVFCSNK